MVGCGIRDTRGRGTGGLGVLVEGTPGVLVVHQTKIAKDIEAIDAGAEA